MAGTKAKKLKIFYDKVANSLVVWFDDPKNAVISEEAENEVIFMKDKEDNVIGFEKLNFIVGKNKDFDKLPLELETPRVILA